MKIQPYMGKLRQPCHDNSLIPVIDGLKQRLVKELFNKYPSLRQRYSRDGPHGFLDGLARTVEWSDLLKSQLDVESLEAWGLEAALSRRIVGMLATNETNCNIQELVFWQLMIMNNLVIPNEACLNAQMYQLA